MKLKYYIEFSETIEGVKDIESEELSKISSELKRIIYKYLDLGGFVTDEIKVEFDLEE